MTSRATVQVSPPTWGALARLTSGERPEALRPAARRTRAPLELRSATAFPSEAVAGAALLVLWVLLWVVFTAGVVGPASSLGRGAGRTERIEAPGTPPVASDASRPPPAPAARIAP
jgi:hypothetical protein